MDAVRMKAATPMFGAGRRTSGSTRWVCTPSNTYLDGKLWDQMPHSHQWDTIVHRLPERGGGYARATKPMNI